MRRRRRKQSVLANDFAKPALGLVLLGLLWLSFKVGLLPMAGNTLIAPLGPNAPTNAGGVYQQQRKKRAEAEARTQEAR
ncbi:MAG: hypothetical protein V4579_09850 [Pseudomonadota bacterium]